VKSVAGYSDSVALALGSARLEARAGGAREVEPGHLLMGLTNLCRLDLGWLLGGPDVADLDRVAVVAEADQVRERFATARVDPTTLRRRIRTQLAVAGPKRDGTPRRSPAARWAFTRAGDRTADGETIGAVALLHGVLQDSTTADRFALKLADFFPEEAALGEVGWKKQDPESATPVLDRFGRDLTRLAREDALEPLIGRREELRALARVLVKQRKANAILVGPTGVGKTGIVEGLAAQLAGPKPVAGLENARVVAVSMATLLAGTKYRGEFEQRLEAVVKDAYELVIREGGEARGGVREREHVVEGLLVQPLGRALLDRRFADGTVLCAEPDADGEALLFTPKEPAPR
jgi:ATP-dependent Clp protease ATP-binding subunit ClpC